MTDSDSDIRIGPKTGSDSDSNERTNERTDVEGQDVDLSGSFTERAKTPAARRTHRMTWMVEQEILDVLLHSNVWIGDDGQPLDYLPEREIRIGNLAREIAARLRSEDA